jgi:aminomethyltransferase
MDLDGIKNIKPFCIAQFTYAGSEGALLMIWRTGFTGDLGDELWIAADLALEFWDALYVIGKIMAFSLMASLPPARHVWRLVLLCQVWNLMKR